MRAWVTGRQEIRRCFCLPFPKFSHEFLSWTARHRVTSSHIRVARKARKRMKLRVLLLLIAVAMMFGAAAYAHHSFTATYEDAKTIKIEGKIVQFQFRNPHSFVHVMAPDEKGEMQRWAVEWGGTGQLGNAGVTATTLKVGDQVVITGPPGRNPADHRMLMRTLLRPSDGFGWGQRPGQVVD